MIEERRSSHPAEPIRSALAERRRIEVVEVYDSMTARLAQQVGFDGVLLGVGAVANFSYGLPDVGLLELPEALEMVRRVCECVNLPVFADVDDGGGPLVNINRTVALAERAGAAGIMVEDTDSSGPKLLWNEELGNWDWRAARMYPAEVGAARIRRVASSRRDPRFMIMGRTDSLRVEPESGLEGAFERARLYAEAGADLIFMLGLVEEHLTTELVESVPAPIVFSKPGGIDQRERILLKEMGIDFLFHALVPRLSPYLAYKNLLVSLKNAELPWLGAPPWDINLQVLETVNLPGWSRLLRYGAS